VVAVESDRREFSIEFPQLGQSLCGSPVHLPVSGEPALHHQIEYPLVHEGPAPQCPIPIEGTQRRQVGFGHLRIGASPERLARKRNDIDIRKYDARTAETIVDRL
jgi:hypothetical protein